MSITEQQLKVYDRVLATISTSAIIIAGIWSLLRYFETRDYENKLLDEKIKLEKFNEKKIIYFELCDAESEIAACNSYEEVIVAQKKFWKLYLGKAHIIADLDADVNKQKIKFGDLLNTYIQNRDSLSPYDYFAKSTLELSEICKRNLDINSVYK